MVLRNTVKVLPRPDLRPCEKLLPGAMPPKHTTNRKPAMTTQATGSKFTCWPMTKNSTTKYSAQMAASQPRSATQLRSFSFSLRRIFMTQAKESCTVPRIKQSFIMVFCCVTVVTLKYSG